LKAALEQMRIDIAARDKQIDNLERQVVKLLARVDDLEGR
jgi:cell division protein FtsB